MIKFSRILEAGEQDLSSVPLQFTHFSCCWRWCFEQGGLNIYMNKGPQKRGRSGKRGRASGAHSGVASARVGVRTQHAGERACFRGAARGRGQLQADSKRGTSVWTHGLALTPAWPVLSCVKQVCHLLRKIAAWVELLCFSLVPVIFTAMPLCSQEKRKVS